MTSDRVLRWCARSYAQLLWILRLRDNHERQAIRDDGERLLEAGQVARATRFNRLAFIGVAITYAVGISLSFALALYS